MKNRLFLIPLFLLLLAFSCQKKEEQKVTIHVTDYIANTPLDKSFNDKFIVLEFWATWCAPCLDAVPHINDLQSKFKSNSDLIFISITDESPEKVAKTLNRIDFNSIVISDQTKKTHRELGVEKDGVMAIPITILIDKNGIVRWKGNPQELNESILKDFISGKEIQNISNQSTESSKPNEMDKQNVKIEDNAVEILKNKQTLYSFTLIQTEGDDSMIVNGMVKGKYIVSNKKLAEILADLNNVHEQQIKIPNSFAGNKYSLIYKNSTVKSINDAIIDVKRNLLNTLNLKENIENQNSEIYKLIVIDKYKLEMSKESKNEMGHSGNGGYIVCSNTKIQSLITEINVAFNIHLIDQTKLMGRYNFLIRKKSIGDLMTDLEKYGLKLEKSLAPEKTYKYE